MKNFRIYTDGSASTLGKRCGSFCAVIQEYDSPEDHEPIRTHMTGGTVFPSSIGRMELMAVNAALNLVVQECNGSKSGYSIEVYCDSTYVADCATGSKKRSANQPEWSMFDNLARGMDIVIQQASRNTLKPQEHCDTVAGVIRQKLEETLPQLEYTQV
jgi:ribonuclease HI